MFALAIAMLFSLTGCTAEGAQAIEPEVSVSDSLEPTEEAAKTSDAEAEVSSELVEESTEENIKTAEEEVTSTEPDSNVDETSSSETADQQDPTEPEQEDIEPEVSETVELVSYTYTDLTQTLYAAAALNVRSGPSTDYGVIGGYAQGGAITVTGQCDQTGWYRVSYNGAIGYVSNQYVSESASVVEPTGSSESGSSSSAPPDTKVTSYDGYVVPKGSISVSLLQTANANAALLPEAVRTAFVNSGWTICISEADIDDTYCDGKYGSVVGLTVYSDKTIYLANREKGVSRQIITHETGHFWDWYCGLPSQTDEFASIYSAEWSTFKSAFNYSNGSQTSYELFAEAFYRYQVSGDQLKASCPQLYAFMEKYCNF